MGTKSTDMLEEEHRVIQKVVGVLAAMAEALETGGELESDTLRDIVDFMRTFADKCHHGKEETHLFPLLVEKGIPVQGCPMAVLNHEHQQGRALVASLADAAEDLERGDPKARESLLTNLQNLTALYPNHIWKEDYLLFPMVNKILDPKEQEDLSGKFEKVEEVVGREVHERFVRLAERLEVRSG